MPKIFGKNGKIKQKKIIIGKKKPCDVVALPYI